MLLFSLAKTSALVFAQESLILNRLNISFGERSKCADSSVDPKCVSFGYSFFKRGNKMSFNLRTLETLKFDPTSTPAVFVRLDLNVPMSKGQISDDTRIRSALPTLLWLIERGCKIIACSHLGRPKGLGFEEEFSMAPIGSHLASLLGKEVLLCPDYLEEGFGKIVSDLRSHQIILLENLRFFKEEQAGKGIFNRSKEL